jgi:CheY-like chemotaxis protein
MSRQELDTVFESFVQGRQELHRPQGGLGLGLAIVRNLARLHGGSIAADSRGQGKGSEFTLRLPLCVAPVAAVAPPPPPATARAGTTGKRILLVDDNADAAHSLAEILRLDGHEVLLALDGPSALALLASAPAVDVAVLDIGLPVMSGYELAERLRKNEEEGQHMRIVALSGFGQERDRALALQSGFDAYLVKPVDLDVLTRTIAGSGSLVSS